ncbi:MAG: universal stress protein [Candidatus Omnitrophica bacterium]|nr:universal stress protein [Candidatus Omnitrophota bacterium]
MAIKHIVLSVAAAPVSLITAKYAIYLAKALQAKITAIYVVNEKVLQELLKSRIFVEVEARDYERDLEEQGGLFLERIKKMAESKGVECSCMLLKGGIHEEVVNKTRELGADILVMGELKELLSRKEVFYDEGERIFRESPCPVVVVKNPAEVEKLYKELI